MTSMTERIVNVTNVYEKTYKKFKLYLKTNEFQHNWMFYWVTIYNNIHNFEKEKMNGVYDAVDSKQVNKFVDTYTKVKYFIIYYFLKIKSTLPEYILAQHIETYREIEAENDELSRRPKRNLEKVDYKL
jgi:hypothetical protein